MLPDGFIRARYSPEAFRLKFVCSALPVTRRFLPDANTTMYSPAFMVISGNIHLYGKYTSSVSVHPPKYMSLPE